MLIHDRAEDLVGAEGLAEGDDRALPPPRHVVAPHVGLRLKEPAAGDGKSFEKKMRKTNEHFKNHLSVLGGMLLKGP